MHELENWIDPDVVASEFGKSNPHLSPDEISREAFKLARSKRVDYAQALQTFGFETVFSHPSNIEFLDALKTLGYTVHLYFVCTDDPQINVGRVRNRHDLGGHDVPEDKIVARYSRAIDGLRQSVRLFDRVVLFDNSEADGLGRAIGQIANDGATTIELTPLPYLPGWVVSTTGAFQRSEPLRTMRESKPFRNDDWMRRIFLRRFLID